jgi:hypothetical protein
MAFVRHSEKTDSAGLNSLQNHMTIKRPEQETKQLFYYLQNCGIELKISNGKLILIPIKKK